MWRCPICETLNEDGSEFCRICSGKKMSCAPPLSLSLDPIEEMVREAEALAQRGELSDARDVYDRIANANPRDYRGWLGLAVIDTDHFAKLDVQQEDKQSILAWLEKAARFVPPEKRTDIEAIRADYEQRMALWELIQQQKEDDEQRRKEALRKKQQATIKREAPLFALGTLIPALTAVMLVCLNAAQSGVFQYPGATYISLPPWAFPLAWAVLCVLSLSLWRYSKALIVGTGLHWITALFAYGNYYVNRRGFFSWANNGVTDFYLDLLALLNDAQPPSHFFTYVIWPWVVVEFLGIVCLLIWMARRRKWEEKPVL